MQSGQPGPRRLQPEPPEQRVLGVRAGRGVPAMEMEKEFHRLDQAASWAAIYQVRGGRPAPLCPRRRGEALCFGRSLPPSGSASLRRPGAPRGRRRLPLPSQLSLPPFPPRRCRALLPLSPGVQEAPRRSPLVVASSLGAAALRGLVKLPVLAVRSEARGRGRHRAVAVRVDNRSVSVVIEQIRRAARWKHLRGDLVLFFIILHLAHF